jgi:hypothetical protein
VGASSYSCQLDGGAFVDCSSGSKSYSSLGDGSHTFAVTAADSLGNESGVTSYTWTIDTTPPPAPTISSHPPNPSASSSASLSFSSAGAASYSCQLDGGAFVGCSSSESYSGLIDGSHTFAVKAADALGNQSAAATYTWIVDTTPPPTPVITNAPASPSGSGNVTFSFTDADPLAATKQCQLDGGAFADCSSGTVSYTGVPDGSHTFGVRAVDEVGLTSSVTTYTWTVDTTQPIATITDKPPLITNQRTASFSFSAGADNTYACSLDGAPATPCTSPQLYPSLADGKHTFSVQATHLGNTGPPALYSWTIDTVAPDTAVSSGPPNPSHSASAVFAFRSSEPGSTFWCSLDAAGFTPCTTPYTYSGLGDGLHTFRVEAIDAAGNTDPTSASYSWQISGVGPPKVDHTPPGNVRRLHRNVSYRLLELHWRNPRDSDFDHVSVFVSTSAKTAARTAVFTGRKTRYRDYRFKNGLYYKYLVVTYDHGKNASRGVVRVVSPSVLLLWPRNGQVVKKPPRLRWNEVTKATFYNVQLYYGNQKVLSAWPARGQLKVRRFWRYAGRGFRMRRGTYHWYVWPAFGPRSASRYGQLLGQGSFAFK